MTFKIGGTLLKDTALYVIADGINKAIPFLVLPIIVQYLTPEDYGIITNYAVLTQIVSVFIYGAAQGSIPVNFFKLPTKDFRRYLNNIFSLAIITSTIFAFLLLCFSPMIERVLDLNLNYILLSLVEVFFGAFTCINMLLWRCEEKPVKFGLYQISQTVISVTLTLLFVINLKLAWEGKILATLISVVVMGILSLIILSKRGYFCYKLDFSYSKIVLSFALPLIPHALALWGKSGVDKVLITNLEGLTENGIYSTALTWGAIVTIIITSFGNAYNPYALKKLAQCESLEEQERNTVKKNLVLSSYAFILGLFLIVLCSYFVFHAMIIFIYPESYHGAVVFLPWILIGELFRGSYLIFVNFIHFTMNTKILGLITFSLTILQILLSYLFISSFGTIGAAISTCLISLLTAMLIGIYSNKVYPMPWLFTSK